MIAVHWYPGGSDLYWYMQWIIDLTGREVWLTEAGPATPASDQDVMNSVNFLVDSLRQRPSSLSSWTRIFYYRLWDGTYNAEALLLPDWSYRPGFLTYQYRISQLQTGAANRLSLGDKLYADDALYSMNGEFKLIYQSDGNLVIYRLSDNFVPWASNTEGTSTGEVVMQGDGNLVLYDAWSTPWWDTGTWGHDGAYAELGDDGVLRVRSHEGTILWSSH